MSLLEEANRADAEDWGKKCRSVSICNESIFGKFFYLGFHLRCEIGEAIFGERDRKNRKCSTNWWPSSSVSNSMPFH
jgi:hypothetical protein